MLAAGAAAVSTAATQTLLQHVLSAVSGVQHGISWAEHAPQLLRVRHGIVGCARVDGDRVSNTLRANVSCVRLYTEASYDDGAWYVVPSASTAVVTE